MKLKPLKEKLLKFGMLNLEVKCVREHLTMATYVKTMQALGLPMMLHGMLLSHLNVITRQNLMRQLVFGLVVI